jgi:hypothetical protein
VGQLERLSRRDGGSEWARPFSRSMEMIPLSSVEEEGRGKRETETTLSSMMADPPPHDARRL